MALGRSNKPKPGDQHVSKSVDSKWRILHKRFRRYLPFPKSQQLFTCAPNKKCQGCEVDKLLSSLDEPSGLVHRRVLA